MRALDQGFMVSRSLTVLQMLPALEGGGVERGTLEVGKYLVDHGHRSLVMSAGGRMVAQLEREGSEHFAWPVGRKSLWTLRLIWRLRRFLVEQKVDILHVRSRMPGWVAYLAWKGMDPATRPHLVTTVHGPYTVYAYSAVMTKGERIIAISEFIRDYIRTNYPEVPAENIRLIYRGVDPAQFPRGYQPSPEWLSVWRQQYPQLYGKRVLTLPARVTRWKGQEDFIDLIAALKQRGEPVHGLIVGEAHRRKQEFMHELQNKVAALGLQQDITFTGHRTDLKEIMAVSDVVFSLSRAPEAFGRTTLEALNLGVPVLAYDHGGATEVLAHLFPSGKVPFPSEHALLDKTCQLLREIPEVGVNTHMTLQAMLAATLAVYHEVAALPKSE